MGDSLPLRRWPVRAGGARELVIVKCENSRTPFGVCLFLPYGNRRSQMQYAGGILLPPVQTLVATFIFAMGENANESLRVTKFQFIDVFQIVESVL